MTIADRCEEHRCPVYNASPRRAAKRLFGGFLFPGIFPTAGKRGRIGAKLIYDSQQSIRTFMEHTMKTAAGIRLTKTVFGV